MQLENENIYNLIINSLSNTISSIDKQALNQWINKSKDNRETFDQIKNIWENENGVKSCEHGNWVGLEQQLKDRNWPVFMPMFSKIAIAASVCLFLALGWLLLDNKWETSVLQTTSDSFLSDTLSNGWIVYLYPNSRLSTTKTYLHAGPSFEFEFSGEGFFIIPENQSKLSCINIGDANIQVNGTSFRVNSCRLNSDFSVLVESGELELNNKFESKQPLTINAGEQGFYSCSNKMIWKDRKEENIYLIYQPNVVGL